MNYTSWSINITRHNRRDNDSVLIAQKLMYEHVFFMIFLRHVYWILCTYDGTSSYYW